MLFRAHFHLDLRRQNCEAQVSHAPQVVGGTCKSEDPIHLTDSAMPQLAKQRDRLQPAKAFFDSLPFLLTNGIAWMARGAPINGAYLVVYHSGQHAE